MELRGKLGILLLLSLKMEASLYLFLGMSVCVCLCVLNFVLLIVLSRKVSKMISHNIVAESIRRTIWSKIMTQHFNNYSDSYSTLAISRVPNV